MIIAPAAAVNTLHCIPLINPFTVGVPIFFWRRKWQPTPVLLPGKSHGLRSLVAPSLVGYSPWGHKESDTTERRHFTSLPYFMDEKMKALKSQVICLELQG